MLKTRDGWINGTVKMAQDLKTSGIVWIQKGDSYYLKNSHLTFLGNNQSKQVSII